MREHYEIICKAVVVPLLCSLVLPDCYALEARDSSWKLLGKEAAILYANRNYQPAVVDLRRALADTSLREQPAEVTVDLRLNLALLLIRMNKLEEAGQILDAVHETITQHGCIGTLLEVRYLRRRFELERSRGKLSDCMKLKSRIVKVMGKLFGDKSSASINEGGSYLLFLAEEQQWSEACHIAKWLQQRKMASKSIGERKLVADCLGKFERLYVRAIVRKITEHDYRSAESLIDGFLDVVEQHKDAAVDCLWALSNRPSSDQYRANICRQVISYVEQKRPPLTSPSSSRGYWNAITTLMWPKVRQGIRDNYNFDDETERLVRLAAKNVYRGQTSNDKVLLPIQCQCMLSLIILKKQRDAFAAARVLNEIQVPANCGASIERMYGGLFTVTYPLGQDLTKQGRYDLAVYQAKRLLQAIEREKKASATELYCCQYQIGNWIKEYTDLDRAWRSKR